MTYARGVALIAGVLALAAAGCGEEATEVRAPDVSPPVDATLEPVDRIAHPDIDECSGIVFHGGVYWTHNDSGGKPMLYRSPTPDFVAALALPVLGAEAVDWEEIAVFGEDLLVCDLGDNQRSRSDLVMYLVDPALPDTAGGAGLTVRATYPVEYPDGPHDAEGVAVIAGKVHVITKDRGEGTLVFRFDELVDGETNVPNAIGKLDLGDREQVTAADFDPRTGTLVLLTYTQIAGYDVTRLEGSPQKSTWIGARQAEALCIRGDDLLFTNEQRDVFRVRDFRKWSHRRLWPKRGVATLADGKPSAVSLLDAAEGESLTWSLGDDSVSIELRLAAPDKIRPTKPEQGALGTGVLLGFGTEPERHLGGDQVVLAVVASVEDGEGGGLYAVGFTDEGIEMVAVEAAVTSATEDGFLTLSAEIPLEQAFAGPAPARFRFGAFAVKYGKKPRPLFSVNDFYALYRPYLWGDVTVGD